MRRELLQIRQAPRPKKSLIYGPASAVRRVYVGPNPVPFSFYGCVGFLWWRPRSLRFSLSFAVRPLDDVVSHELLVSPTISRQLLHNISYKRFRVAEEH